jgi:hypothetical protein
MAESTRRPPPVGQRLVKRPTQRVGKPAPRDLQAIAAGAVRASGPSIVRDTRLSEAQVRVAIAAVVRVLPEVLTHVAVDTLGEPQIDADVCGGNACAPHYDAPHPDCSVQCEGETLCGAQACPYNSCASHHCGGQDCPQHACSSESCPTNECGEESCRLLACPNNEGCDEHECPEHVMCVGDQCSEETCASQDCTAHVQCQVDETEAPDVQMASMTRTRLWRELIAEIAAAGPTAIDRARALQLEVVTRR